MSTLDQLEAIVRNHGFEHFGFTNLKTPLSLDIYREWLNQGCHGEMSYLERHLEKKADPKKLLPLAHSALVVAVNYVPHPHQVTLPKGLKVARYAQGEDYHHWLKARLEKVSREFQLLFPGHEFLCMTDSSPVLERDLAYRAGLGWVGKNTCLIDQERGSFFLIGEIYMSLPLELSIVPHPDRCGTCTRCIEACPTKALVEPRKLDARRCISYWTIESRSLPPEDLRENFKGWYFGCDICQEVCPWNQKVFSVTLQQDQSKHEDILEDIKSILTASGKELERRFAGTALSRTSSKGHKRNALLVAAHHNLRELESEVRRLVQDEKIGKIAEWVLEKWNRD